MTYQELVAELEAAKVPEDAVNVVLALTTEAYENGFEAGYTKAQTEASAAYFLAHPIL